MNTLDNEAVDLIKVLDNLIKYLPNDPIQVEKLEKQSAILKELVIFDEPKKPTMKFTSR